MSSFLRESWKLIIDDIDTEIIFNFLYCLMTQIIYSLFIYIKYYNKISSCYVILNIVNYSSWFCRIILGFKYLVSLILKSLLIKNYKMYTRNISIFKAYSIIGRIVIYISYLFIGYCGFWGNLNFFALVGSKFIFIFLDSLDL